ncbi:MAG: hypothetical protein HYR85_07630 [Planctomycetes bacterium]|nr:hypothetical protein [Planctomycetota bacterium]
MLAMMNWGRAGRIAVVMHIVAGCASLRGSSGRPIEVVADRDVEVGLAAWLLAGGSFEPGSLRAAAASDLEPLTTCALVADARRAIAGGQSLNEWVTTCLDDSTDVRSFRDEERWRAFLAASDGVYRRAAEHVRDALPLGALADSARRSFAIPTERRLDVIVSFLAPEALGVAIDRSDRRIAIVSPRLLPGGRARPDVRARFELAGVILHEFAHPEARAALRANAPYVAALEERLGALASSSGLTFAGWLEENLASAAACVGEADALGRRDADAFEREEERRGLVLVPRLRDRLSAREIAFGDLTPILEDLGAIDMAPLDRRARLAAELRLARGRRSSALEPLVTRYPDDLEPRFALAEALFEEDRTLEAEIAFRAIVASPNASAAPDLVEQSRNRLRHIDANRPP